MKDITENRKYTKMKRSANKWLEWILLIYLWIMNLIKVH